MFSVNSNTRVKRIRNDIKTSSDGSDHDNTTKQPVSAVSSPDSDAGINHEETWAEAAASVDRTEDDRRTACEQLTSPEQERLLNAIDKLRNADISGSAAMAIPVPQIVVCGDQSSGKSSVLAAISQLPFPSGANTVTRFVTRLVLRNQANESVRVSIEAAKKGVDKRKGDFEKFNASMRGRSHQLKDFKDIHQKACEFLRSQKCWEDCLCIEATGPALPHLTLVDLPGLISTQIEKGEDDIRAVRNLVKAYIKQPRTLVLAVMSARGEVLGQGTLQMLLDADLAERSLGVITGPDCAITEDVSQAWVEVAQNNDQTKRLGLGWHVVCNLTHSDPDQSATHRDENENVVLNRPIWSKLRQQDRGIQALRQKLSKHLFRLVQEELPDLADQVSERRSACKDTLSKFGDARPSTDERRDFLMKTAREVSLLLRAAVDANDNAEHARAFFDSNKENQLRHRIAAMLDDYTQILEGSQAYELFKPETTASVSAPGSAVEEDAGSERQHSSLADDDVSSIGEATRDPFKPMISFRPPFDDIDKSSTSLPIPVDAEHYFTALKRHMSQNMGRELPATECGPAIRAVFRQQTLKWRPITTRFSHRLCALVANVVYSAMIHVAGRHTGLLLWEQYGSPACKAQEELLETKVNEILWPYEHSHPITYSNAFKRSPTHWRSQAPSIEPTGQDAIALQAYDFAMSYYQVAITALTQNFCGLAIEKCLLSGLSNVLTDASIFRENEDVIDRVGGEPAENVERRTIAMSQLAVLDDVYPIFCRYAESSSMGD